MDADIIRFLAQAQVNKSKKLQACEGGAHLIICLAFIDELEKQLFIKKKLKWANKKIKVF